MSNCDEIENSEETEGTLCCPICLVNYEKGDTICWSRNPMCNHHFHSKCIMDWLMQDRKDCPCCRHDYLAQTGKEEEGIEDYSESEDTGLASSDETSESESSDEAAGDPDGIYCIFGEENGGHAELESNDTMREMEEGLSSIPDPPGIRLQIPLSRLSLGAQD
jgi:hypothetical protein